MPSIPAIHPKSERGHVQRVVCLRRTLAKIPTISVDEPLELLADARRMGDRWEMRTKETRG